MSVAKLAVRLVAETDGFDTVLKKSERLMKDFGDSSHGLMSKITKLGAPFEGLASKAALGGAAMGAAGIAVAGVAVAAAAATAAVSTLGAAMVDAFSKTSKLGDELFTMAQRTGVTVETLSALRFAAGQTGTSLDGMSAAVFQMQNRLGAGGSATRDALKSIGLSINELRAANPADAFAQIVDKLGEIPGATARATAGAALFGKGFREIAQLTQEDLGGLINRARDLGAVMSTETAVAADRFNDALGEIRATAEGVAIKVGNALLPGMIAFAETIQGSFSQAVKAAGVSSAGLGRIVDTVVIQIGQSAARLVRVVANMVDTLSVWATGAFLQDLAVLNLLGKIEERVVRVGRAWDMVFNAGAGKAQFDVWEAEAKGLQKFATSAVTTVLTAGATLRKLAQTTADIAAGVGENFAATYDRIQREIKDSANEMRRDLGKLGGAGEDAAKRITKAFKTIPVDLGLSSLPGLRFPVGAPLQSPFPSVPVRDVQLTKLPGIEVPVGAPLELVRPFRDAFEQFGRDLPDIIFGTLKNGGNLVGAIASGLGAQFADTFQKALDKIKEAGTGALTKSQKALGLLGIGLSSFTSGFGIGQATNKTKGALGGAAAGALAGSFAGPAGIVVGAGLGALGGFFGGRAADKKAKEALDQNKIALAEQFGGMDKLRALAEKLGVNIQAAFDAKKPAQFQLAVDSLNVAIERQNTRIAGLSAAMEGVNRRAEIFADPFRKLVSEREGLGTGGDPQQLAGVNAKIAEVAQRTQPEFDRLGLMVRDTFAGLIKESGNAFEAVMALAPSFGVLKEGVSDFGLTSTAVINELLKTFSLVNDEAFGPLLQNVQSSGQVLKGLFDAKSLSPEGFQAIAADIGQSLQELQNKGGDISHALALSQPVLQTLWEAQQRFGGVTDQTTQSILNQAQQQGLVGDHMKSVNDKILSVLVAIADVFGAKLPAAFRETERGAKGAFDGITDTSSDAFKELEIQAQEAARDVETAFKRIKFDPIELPFHWTADGMQGPGVPAMARGGIVRRPTLALIGEKGPEVVIPLTGQGLQLRGVPSDTRAPGPESLVVNIYGDVDSEDRAREMVMEFARQVSLGGRPRSMVLTSLGLR